MFCLNILSDNQLQQPFDHYTLNLICCPSRSLWKSTHTDHQVVTTLLLTFTLLFAFTLHKNQNQLLKIYSAFMTKILTWFISVCSTHCIYHLHQLLIFPKQLKFVISLVSISFAKTKIRLGSWYTVVIFKQSVFFRFERMEMN